MGEQSAEGVASVGERPLLLAGDFGEGEVEGRDEEEGIVAEAVGASGGGEELAFGGAFGAEEDLAVAGEGEVADEVGGVVGLVAHEEEEEGVVAVVLGALKYRGLSTTLRSGRDDGVLWMVEEVVVGEAGGADAGLVVEGWDFEA